MSREVSYMFVSLVARSSMKMTCALAFCVVLACCLQDASCQYYQAGYPGYGVSYGGDGNAFWTSYMRRYWQTRTTTTYSSEYWAPSSGSLRSSDESRANTHSSTVAPLIISPLPQLDYQIKTQAGQRLLCLRLVTS